MEAPAMAPHWAVPAAAPAPAQPLRPDCDPSAHAAPEPNQQGEGLAAHSLIRSLIAPGRAERPTVMDDVNMWEANLPGGGKWRRKRCWPEQGPSGPPQWIQWSGGRGDGHRAHDVQRMAHCFPPYGFKGHTREGADRRMVGLMGKN